MTDTLAKDEAQKAAHPNPVKGGVIAYLTLDGAITAGELYKKALGAELVHLHPADDKGRTMHMHLYINGSSVMLGDGFPEHGHSFMPLAGFSLMLPVADVDAWWQRAVDAGFSSNMKPEDMFWGDRYAQAKDPFGVQWAFVGPKKS
jgi:PhnB protein